MRVITLCIPVYTLQLCEQHPSPLNPLMYLLPKPSLPHSPQHGCLLSSVIDGLCRGCRSITSGISLFEETLYRKGGWWKQSQYPECTERQKDTYSFSGRRSWEKCVSVPRISESEFGKETLNTALPLQSGRYFFKTAVLWQFHDGTFQNPQIWI